MAQSHEILGGKVHLHKRGDVWHASASIEGRQFRKTTKKDSLSLASEVAEDWYLTLKGKHRFGGGLPLPKMSGPKFPVLSAKFLVEFGMLAGSERSKEYLRLLKSKITTRLDPFFRELTAPEITDTKIQQYRLHRAAWVDTEGNPKPPSRSTIHHEIIALRHVLKTAKRDGLIDHLPDLSAPYRASGKITHRAWFSPEEYTKFYEATRDYAKLPKDKWTWEREQFHDYVLFMANTGLRPDEAARLQFRDVSVIYDHDTKKEILLIEVRGKRGTGWCKSMPMAVEPFTRLSKRPRSITRQLSPTTRERRGSAIALRAKGISRFRPRGSTAVGGGSGELRLPQPTDVIFGTTQRDLMNAMLAKLELKFDRDGQRRTAYSLRHTYICFRLLELADIYQVAKNCRTSVEMIQKYYADHISTNIDTSALNVLKKRRKTEPKASNPNNKEKKNAA